MNPYQIQMRLRCLQRQTVLLVVFKVCFKTNREVCGGVWIKVFIGLTAIDFIRLSSMARGNINKIFALGVRTLAKAALAITNYQQNAKK